jgi:hypothetical protein
MSAAFAMSDAHAMSAAFAMSAAPGRQQKGRPCFFLESFAVLAPR